MLSPVRTEIIKIVLLILLLGLGVLYITHTGVRNLVSSVDFSLRISPGDLGVFERTFTGQPIPALAAREVFKGRQELASFDSVGVIILIAGNTCIQKQASDLRRVFGDI